MAYLLLREVLLPFLELQSVTLSTMQLIYLKTQPRVVLDVILVETESLGCNFFKIVQFPVVKLVFIITITTQLWPLVGAL